MKKRILSGILALTMCFSMTPSSMGQWHDGILGWGGIRGVRKERRVYRRAGDRGGERTAGSCYRRAGGGKWVQ